MKEVGERGTGLGGAGMSEGAGTVAGNWVLMAPGSAKSMTISSSGLAAMSCLCARNMRSGGSWKPSVMTWRPAAMDLPERRKNGTPCQRQFSTSAVVDAEDLRLVEDRVHRLVQRARRGQVGAEPLLDYHPGIAGNP